jgi:HSP20 family protein
MSIVKWDPFRDIVRTTRGMNRFFNEPVFRFFEDEGYSMWSPVVDIYNEDDKLMVKAEMPGLSKEDIDIRVENGILTISGEKKREKEYNEENSYRLERCYGKFIRSFSLPMTVDVKKIDASYKDGVLHVILPKAEESKPKRVNIS